MTQFNYKYRYLAQITIEAITPLQIGSGRKGIKTDSLVIRDVNGLPFIPGTTLAGLIAHALGQDREILMGSQKEGSRLIITEGKLLDKYGKVLDGIVDLSSLDHDNQSFLKNYERLPIRQHVRIGHKGVAEDTGKFDEEVVLKGSRFVFEMELVSQGNETEKFKALLSILKSPSFRIGSGSRSGYGEIKIINVKYRELNLTEAADCKLYLNKSSKLGSSWNGWQDGNDKLNKEDSCNEWTLYKLELKPENFILFGSGFGDPQGNADMTYVKEVFVTWNDNGDCASIAELNKIVLIPGSSVKGALSHRTAFYYNKLTDAVMMDDGTLKNGKHINEVVGSKNIAVKAIFGSEGEKNKRTNKLENKQRGNILISDVIEVREQAKPKILNHVSIDRFTGGAIDGALFNEQTLYVKGETFIINILIDNKAFVEKNVQTAFESSLKDVVTGMLPLGGGINRGNGVFSGKVNKRNMENELWEELK